jgi:hypothetical protein
MRICPLLDIGFDMNLGKILGRENGGSRPLPCQSAFRRHVKRVLRFYGRKKLDLAARRSTSLLKLHKRQADSGKIPANPERAQDLGETSWGLYALKRTIVQ